VVNGLVDGEAKATAYNESRGSKKSYGNCNGGRSEDRRYKFKGKFKDARLKRKGRRPLQNQKHTHDLQRSPIRHMACTEAKTTKGKSIEHNHYGSFWITRKIGG
jgi:hypothetical protein